MQPVNSNPYLEQAATDYRHSNTPIRPRATHHFTSAQYTPIVHKMISLHDAIIRFHQAIEDNRLAEEDERINKMAIQYILN